MNLLAHLVYEDGVRREQSLRQHCEETARYAKESIEDAGLGNTAYLAGFLHDMGKGSAQYQQYLEDGAAGKPVVRGSVNHTFAGVIYILERYHGEAAGPMECLTSEMIACGIGGHHGLFDCLSLDGENGFLHRLRKDRKEIGYDEAVMRYLTEVASEECIDELFQASLEEVTAFYNSVFKEWAPGASKVFYQIGMAVRLIQSAVMYGDRRDTREFIFGRKDEENATIDWKRQTDFLDLKLEEFSSDSPINTVRGQISNQCYSFAEKACGIYQMNVPTGGGKTLSALRYALHHAEIYGKRRIIFTIPLLSILDQNAKVIRKNLTDEGMVLEHHSNVLRKKAGRTSENDGRDELDPYEILVDTWHSPVIVSTLVQFLEILFSSKTTAVARMQALCDSVIVIDEVQSLPVNMTAMFNMALNFLSACCNATIVLSSATQPTFDALEWPLRYAPESNMVHLDEVQLLPFKRAEIIDKTTPYGMDWDECTFFCAERIAEHPSVLIICNTKREARTLFKRLHDLNQDGWSIYHLSTSMCLAHRADVLSEIMNQLETVQGQYKRQNSQEDCKKVICVSTQLVEAGVDFSFSCVIRVLAGIDNFAQAVGRCNRSGEYGTLGKAYLINLKEENLGMIPDISRAQDAARKVLNHQSQYTNQDLIGVQASQEFYSQLFFDAKKDVYYPLRNQKDGCHSKTATDLYMAKLLGRSCAKKITYENDDPESRRFVLKQPFQTLGREFQVFEDDTTDVVVPYGEGVRIIEDIRTLGKKPNPSPELQAAIRRAKKYTISIFAYQKDKLDETGMLLEVCDGRILVLKLEAYDDYYGLREISQPDVRSHIL